MKKNYSGDVKSGKALARPAGPGVPPLELLSLVPLTNTFVFKFGPSTIRVTKLFSLNFHSIYFNFKIGPETWFCHAVDGSPDRPWLQWIIRGDRLRSNRIIRLHCTVNSL